MSLTHCNDLIKILYSFFKLALVQFTQSSVVFSVYIGRIQFKGVWKERNGLLIVFFKQFDLSLAEHIQTHLLLFWAFTYCIKLFIFLPVAVLLGMSYWFLQLLSLWHALTSMELKFIQRWVIRVAKGPSTAQELIFLTLVKWLHVKWLSIRRRLLLLLLLLLFSVST